MTFQAYIDNIETKTGKTPEDFKRLAEQKGLLSQDTKRFIKSRYKSRRNCCLAQRGFWFGAWACDGYLRYLKR